jgi:cytochrome c biogenesis protein
MPRLLRRLRHPGTATVLLLALAAAGAVATAVPQQDVAPRSVAAWRDGTEGPGRTTAQVLDALGLFEITTSWWWTALVTVIVAASCWWLVSGWRTLTREWNAAPPRHGFGSAPTGVARARFPHDHAAVVQGVEAVLRARGFRVWTPGPAPGTAAHAGLTAERGRWRAAATLLSHAAVPLLLVGLLTAHAWDFRGQLDLVEGETVVDTPVAYGRSEQGPLWDAGDHPGFTMTLDDFALSFHPDGTPDDFVSQLRIDGNQPAAVRVNHPMRVNGMMISLLRYGVAPHLVIRDRAGTTRFDAPLRLSEAERTWAGRTPLHASGRYVLDAALVSAGDGERERQGAIPADPVLLIDVFAAAGDDPGALLDQVAVPVGGSAPALDGALDIAVERLPMWAGFQVSHPAGRRLLLAGAGLLLVGLTASLWIRRQRVWVDITRSTGGTVVALTSAAAGGDPPGAADLMAALTARLAPLAPRGTGEPTAPDRRAANLGSTDQMTPSASVTVSVEGDPS